MPLAQAGDAAQLAWITDFFLTGDSLAAAFATGTRPTGIESTGGAVLTLCTPAAGRAGLGLVVVLAAGGAGGTEFHALRNCYSVGSGTKGESFQ